MCPARAEHAFPLYSVSDANRLRSRLFETFEDADRSASRIDQGALNVVVVGAGPTGVETAGAVADLVNDVMPKRYTDLDIGRVSIYLVDHGPTVLAPFSDKAHRYAAAKLEELGVELRLQTGVKAVTHDRVVLDDELGDPHPDRRLGRRHQAARRSSRARGCPPGRAVASTRCRT